MFHFDETCVLLKEIPAIHVDRSIVGLETIVLGVPTPFRMGDTTVIRRRGCHSGVDSRLVFINPFTLQIVDDVFWLNE